MNFGPVVGKLCEIVPSVSVDNTDEGRTDIWDE